ncbi:hypothetical protein SSP24_84120 [Streptomyces spinoverrucosus]|uniref:Uncharacterized protein n=2 Tax=Streptomyces spinoverrucosus TaxID=284043 RepID=A0A4Y3VV83_9ACTN|nr:hypothetical protein SSP24_84120 [Streptomyces spinoverrucosus]GHC00147.1 hypothetical protein GCM10010397_85140 [Streptomyces spinoverrucosus]
MLVWGFYDQEELVNELLQLCPTSRYIKGLRQVRQAEWDLLVTDQGCEQRQQPIGVTRVEPHLFVIHYTRGDGYIFNAEHRPGWTKKIASRSGVVSQEIQRMRNLPERVAVLVHEKLEPVITQRTSHRVFELQRVKTPGASNPPEIVPFIATADGEALAGRYARSDSSEAWLLPPDAPDLPAWVQAALAEWHGMAPERFPGVPDWSEQDAWLTNEELALAAEIAGVKKERAEQLDRLEKLEAALRIRMEVARDSANRYERALLTAQSDELKHVVIQALREIGFTVVDADGDAAPDDHLEDLHITDSDAPGWIALGEVKGYSRGAKTEGLTQFLRFNMRYTARSGRNPDACWYIVNQFIKRDPSTRQRVLHGKDEDLKAFGSANGLVIDTVQLFQMLRRVRDGALTAKAARELLRNASGRFAL